MFFLEIFANIFSIGSVYLANRNNIHNWWVGLIGTVLFLVLFYELKLYADVTLQVYFIVTGIWGWWNWAHGKTEKEERKITRTSNSILFLFALILILGTLGYGYVLLHNTDASYPFPDSFIMVSSIIAQFLLMERKLENWVFWILTDAAAVPLYAKKEIYLTAFIYFIFLINAVWGLFHWIKLYRLQNEEVR